MELKPSWARERIWWRRLLIRPEWNWNSKAGMILCQFGKSFNQTRMELKHKSASTTRAGSPPFNQTRMELKPLYVNNGHHKCWLLIRPEWNWNVISWTNSCFFIFLLIRPEWNWNILPKVLWASPNFLLIRPEWNWNYKFDKLKGEKICTFNQTRMELKQNHHQWPEYCFLYF